MRLKVLCIMWSMSVQLCMYTCGLCDAHAYIEGCIRVRYVVYNVHTCVLCDAHNPIYFLLDTHKNAYDIDA